MTRTRTVGKACLGATAIVIVGCFLLVALSERRLPGYSPARLSLVSSFGLGFSYDYSNPGAWVAAISEQAGLLTVYDAGSHQMRSYDLDGRMCGSFGSEGMLPGEFMSPAGVDMDCDGNIYVADRRIPVIRCYARTGDFLRQYPEAQGVWGWSSVCSRGAGVVVASPEPGSALIRRKGLYELGENIAREVTTDCFGPVAVDSRDHVYVLNLLSRKRRGFETHQTIMGIAASGRRVFSARHRDSMLKTSLRYWPQASCLVLTNSGSRRVEAYRTDGTPLGNLLEIPESEPPPIAALPAGLRLYVVHIDGNVRVYRASMMDEGCRM